LPRVEGGEEQVRADERRERLDARAPVGGRARPGSGAALTSALTGDGSGGRRGRKRAFAHDTVGDTRCVAGTAEHLEPLRGRVGDRDDDLVGARRLERGARVADRAEHRHALDAASAKPRVVVEEADDEDVVLAAEVADEDAAHLTGPGEEDAAAAVVRRPRLGHEAVEAARRPREHGGSDAVDDEDLTGKSPRLRREDDPAATSVAIPEASTIETTSRSSHRATRAGRRRRGRSRRSTIGSTARNAALEGVPRPSTKRR
jgi:hypothetical protein